MEQFTTSSGEQFTPVKRKYLLNRKQVCLYAVSMGPKIIEYEVRLYQQFGNGWEEDEPRTKKFKSIYSAEQYYNSKIK